MIGQANKGDNGQANKVDNDPIDSSTRSKRTEGKVRKTKGRREEEKAEESPYQPPVPDNIVAYHDDIAIDDFGESEHTFGQKTTKKKGHDGANIKKKKKVKKSADSVSGDGDLNDSVGSSLYLYDADDAPLSHKKKKKNKVKSTYSVSGDGDLNDSVGSSLYFDDADDAPLSHKKKKKNKVPRRLSAGISLGDETGSKSSKMSKKKSKKKLNSEDTHGSLRSERSGDNLFTSPSGRKKSKKKLRVEEQDITWEDMHDNNFGSINVKKTMKVKKQHADMQEEMKSSFKERLSFRSDPWETQDSDSAEKNSRIDPNSRSSDIDSVDDRRPLEDIGMPTTVHQQSPGGDFRIKNKKLDDFDSFTSNWNGAARMEKDEDVTVTSMAETAASLNNEIEKQRDETRGLQKSLADALSKVATLNKDLRKEEGESADAKNELIEVRSQLNAVADENEAFVKRFDRVERDLELKDHRIESLEQVVENQLDRVEFLEEKIEQAEDEMFLMEDELKELAGQGLLNESTHSKKRLERMDSIRIERKSRVGSIGMERKMSERVIRGIDIRSNDSDSRDDGGDGDVKKSMEELTAWEKELKERERQLDGEREQDDLRESRLDEWERDLMEKESRIMDISIHAGVDDIDFKRRELEERERILMDGRQALEQEKTELAETNRQADREQQRFSELANGGRRMVSNLEIREELEEKDKEIQDLRVECENFLSEKEEIILRHEEEDQQRDEDLRLIQEEINDNLRTLDNENQELRLQLADAEEKNLNTAELQKVIELLEDEVAELRMKATGAGDQDETVRQLQEEITEQLAELDEENQRLSDRIVREEKQFEEKLREKDDIIMDLEDMLEEVQRTLEAGGSGAHTTTLLKELGEHKKRIRSAGKLREDLSEALAQIQEKQSKIEELEESLKQVNEDLLNQNTEKYLVKEARTMQLEEELVAAKTELEEQSSGNYVTRLKNEIKTLKEMHKDMKNKLKREEQDSKAKLKKKDDAVSFMQNEMIKMRRDLDKFEKKEKKRAASKDKANGGDDLQQQIEDLEDEIDHWKAVNFELEDEVGMWKSEANESKNKLNNGINVMEDDDADEEASLGSIQSFNSRTSSVSKMSKHSHHSLSSITQNDLFFVSDATSMTNIPPPPSDEPSTPSQRALRSLGGIWSKMTEKPTTRTNPAIPYTMSLDD
jgi:hypothetical protein